MSLAFLRGVGKKITTPMAASYLTFSDSNKEITIATNTATKTWNGTLEYSTDTVTWNVWDGTTTITSATHEGKHRVYLRGSGNTKITGNSLIGTTDDTYTTNHLVMTGSAVECSGNIENLLDYETVANGEHPVMTNGCFDALFYECYMLKSAPELPATELKPYCYNNMFGNCYNLKAAPKLPATTMEKRCYTGMFEGCINIKTAPELPATTLADSCYHSMFRDCTSLVTTPELPVTTLEKGCYQAMFYGCTSLTTAPELPATTLADYCYQAMFSNCTSLTTAPELPATTLADYCYQNMFSNCTSLVNLPKLPATTLAKYCYNGMFHDCTGIKLSATLTDGYHTEYRIPTSGTGTTAGYALTGMFKNTGGTFTGTPAINTTYYTSNKVV